MEKVAELLKLKSEIYGCSYWTAWRTWITNEEKGKFTFIDIMQHMNEVEERNRRSKRRVLFSVVCFWIIVLYFIFGK